MAFGSLLEHAWLPFRILIANTMGSQCFTSCNQKNGQQKSVQASSRSRRSEQLTHNEIFINLNESVSLGKMLSSTLNKNRNLQSKCSRRSRFGRSVQTRKSADQAIEMKFTLTSARAPVHPPLAIIEETAHHTLNLKAATDQRRNTADLTMKREVDCQNSEAKGQSLQNLSILEDDKSKNSRLWPYRNFHFFRTDFLRILKINPIDKYIFKAKLGQGAQGTVYRALNRRTQEERAIKVILKDSVRNQQDFFAQFQTLRVLDHPNIVKLYEIIEHNNHYYLVTEYCEGGQVISEAKRLKHFSEKCVAALMRDVLSAVMYIHDNNIIHRDLKLENMVFERKVEDGVDEVPPPIKLIDFGTSKFLKTSQNEMLNTPAGTPLYMAPEVLNDRYNNKCDVWSCGVIMYILLSGKPPFRGVSRKNIFNKIRFEPVSFKDKVWDRISSEAKQLLQRMLDKNSRFRISAAQALSSSWIRDCSIGESIGLGVLRDIEKFSFKNKFLAIVLTYLASNSMSQRRRRDLAKIFMQIDGNNSGSIEKVQLIEAYKKGNQKMDERYIQAIFNNIDTDNSGKIDFTEFLVVAEKQEKLLQREYLESAFEFFNTSKSGYLDLEDVRTILGETDDLEAQRIMIELDLNNDQLISKQEFIERLLKYDYQ